MSLGKRLFVGGAADFCMNTSDNPLQEATSSLVAGYSLDYDATDVTGNYDGTPTDVTFGVDGYINWGAEFNGSSSKVALSGSTSLTNRTISMWFNPSKSTNLTLLDNTQGKVNGVKQFGRWNMLFNYSGLNYAVWNEYNGSQYGMATFSYTFNVGTWYHIVFSVESNNNAVYVNGVSQSLTVTRGDSIGTVNLADCTLGFDRDISSLRFDGYIDQVRIFNKALSSAEVTTLYNESACTHTATTDTVGFPSSASSNLVAYYKLDGSAEDESSNSYDGTESNITYEFGRYGTAAVFNGSSSYVSIGNPVPNTDTEVSISAWINLSSGVSTNMHITGTGITTASSEAPFRITLQYQSANTFRLFALRQVAGTYYLSPNASLTDVTINANTWYHLTYSYNPTGRKLTTYLNGSVVDTDVAMTTTGASVNDDSMIIGSFRTNTAFFNGKIDQVRIYDKALSSDEVGELYAEKQAYITKDAKNPFADGDEIAFYKFENNADDEHDSYDGTDSNVTFTSGSGLFGTYAASFNGSSSKVAFNNPIGTGNTDLSYSFWFNSNGFSSGYQTILGTDSNVAPPLKITMRYDSSNSYKIYVERAYSGSIYYYSSSGIGYTASTISPNTWYHLAVTYDASDSKRAKIYLDGSLVDNVTLSSSTPETTSTSQAFGQWRNNNLQSFDGKLDQVRIFDRVLDGDEVFKLYAEVIN